jgi:hypothetical protein
VCGFVLYMCEGSSCGSTGHVLEAPQLLQLFMTDCTAC